MPRVEVHHVEKDLTDGIFWPAYWIYGQENRRARDLINFLHRRFLEASGETNHDIQSLDGSELATSKITELLLNHQLGGGIPFLLIRNAHLLKGFETFEIPWSEKTHIGKINFICVFNSPELDLRKRTSKIILEKAAVVHCETIQEFEREKWIIKAMKEKNHELRQDEFGYLLNLEPWSLDLVDSELEKIILFNKYGGSKRSNQDSVYLTACTPLQREVFIEAFFTKNKKQALRGIESFAKETEEALPTIGMMSWYIRQILYFEQGQKLNPYLLEKIKRWSKIWSRDQLTLLQSCLTELDLSYKQTTIPPFFSWNRLIMQIKGWIF